MRYWASVALAIVLGIALRAPALQGRLLGDDWDHFAMVHGLYPVQRSSLDLYDFAADAAAERRALMSSGRLPWWTAPDFHLAFLRPLSSALLFFDHTVLGSDAPERHHWHSALWWAATLIALAGLLGRTLPKPVALVAVLLYAVDDAHTLPFAWNANRTALVAVALMLGALWAHVAWTQERQTKQRIAALILLTGGIFAGEYALGLVAYFIAHALCAERSDARRRLRALLPFTVPVAAYFIVRSSLGYGVTGSSFYVDPLREPVAYLEASVGRVPLLLGDLLFGYTAEWWYGMPPFVLRVLQWNVLPPAWFSLAALHALQMSVGCVASLLVVAGFWRFSRPEGASLSRSSAWLILGALLSLFPLCGVFPMSRLTIGPAVGIHATLAWIVVHAWRRMATPGALWIRCGALGTIALVVTIHGVVAGLRSHDAVSGWAAISRLEENWVRHAAIDSTGLGERHIIVVSAQDLATQYALPYVRHLHRLTTPASSEILLPPCMSPIDLVRIAANVLDIRLSTRFDRSSFRRNVYWPAVDREVRTGQRFASERFEVRVMATDHGDPTQLRFTFVRPLDDPHYLFLYPVRDGLRPLALPAVGTTLQLAAPSFVTALTHN
jgi:hypothetical protein